MIRQQASVRVLCGLMLCGLMTACSDSASPTGPTGGPGSPSSPTPQVIDRPFTLAINQSAAVPDGTLEVKFIRVVKDERCGSAANCIAGKVFEAALDFEITMRTGSLEWRSTIQLSTDTAKAARIGSFTVSLEQLAPYPIGSAQSDGLKPEDYRVTLRITSN
jgi:hypothetical protein